MSSMFCKCSSLTTLILSNFNTKKVTDMSCMFYECSSLTQLDLSGFDFSSVEDISQMFFRCKSLTSFTPPSVWPTNVREGINLFRVFDNCVKLKRVECPIVCISSFIEFRRVIEANSHF